MNNGDKESLELEKNWVFQMENKNEQVLRTENDNEIKLWKSFYNSKC